MNGPFQFDNSFDARMSCNPAGNDTYTCSFIFQRPEMQSSSLRTDGIIGGDPATRNFSDQYRYVHFDNPAITGVQAQNEDVWSRSVPTPNSTPNRTGEIDQQFRMMGRNSSIYGGQQNVDTITPVPLASSIYADSTAESRRVPTSNSPTLTTARGTHINPTLTTAQASAVGEFVASNVASPAFTTTGVAGGTTVEQTLGTNASYHFMGRMRVGNNLT